MKPSPLLRYAWDGIVLVGVVLAVIALWISFNADSVVAVTH
jgi:hypothetical protein